MRDYQFIVEEPQMDGSGWWFTVHALAPDRRGPFPTELDARKARRWLFVRWNRSARRRGGWAWKATHTAWRITVPNEVLVKGTPMHSAPVAIHLPMATTESECEEAAK